MSRTTPLSFRTAIHAQETGDVPIILLTVDHDDLPSPLRFSSDPTTRITTDPLRYGTVSRTNTFYFVPFNVTLPDDKQESAPAGRLVLDNVDRETIALIRSTSTPAIATLELVMSSAPDTVVILFPELDIVAADYDSFAVNLTLTIEGLQTEPFPAGSMDPAGFPGLF